jgi:hypothetical protein
LPYYCLSEGPRNEEEKRLLRLEFLCGGSTRPIVEAFFHARYFLEMVCGYGRQLTEPPSPLPSGWAAVLYLYGLR